MYLPCTDQEFGRFTVRKGQIHPQLSVPDFVERLVAQLYVHCEGLSAGKHEKSDKNEKNLHFRNT